MINFSVKLILCLLPIGLTPLLGYLIVDSYLNFGGGEKDLFLLIPWVIWAFFYLLVFITMWIKGKDIKTIVVYSIGGATGILAIAWVILYTCPNHILGVYKG